MAVAPARIEALRHLAVAVAAVALAAFLQRELLNVLGHRFPFVPFFPAVMLTALYSGAGAGINATFLSTIYLSYHLAPEGSFFIVQDAPDRVGLLIFTLSCVVICLVVKTLHGARARAVEAELQARVAEVRRIDAVQLLESEARYRNLFENSMDAVFLTVPDGRVTAANSVACAMFGMTEEELCRAGRAGVMDPDDPRLPVALAKRARDGRIICELNCVRRDGSKFEAEVSSVLLNGDRNSFVIIRDITERKQAERTHRRYAQRLIMLEEDLRKAIAMDLHDHVGQLLVALGFNLKHVGQHLPVETRGDVQSILADSGLLVREVTTSIRDLMVELRPHQLDTLGLADAIRSYGLRYSQRTGIELDVLVDEGFPRLISSVETALFRITQEALNNVSKYAGASQVSVSLQHAASVTLIISDDGNGFDLPEGLPEPTGSGWGLTIMRERAELAGGRFSIETELGKGTTITVAMKANSAGLAGAVQ